MPLVDTFDDSTTDTLAKEFIAQGYVIRDVADRQLLIEYRGAIVDIACRILGKGRERDDEAFLNGLHEQMTVEKINEFRLAIFNKMNAAPWCRASYYRMGRHVIDPLVGNELAMQNRVNLSIQMPDDPTSVLPAHSDVWSAETPFEVVQWLPLVDVFATKAMFILPPEMNRTVRARVDAHGNAPVGLDLYKSFEKEFKSVDIPFGKILVFSPILLHGNTMNETNETRWSLNCRFTGLFTPYTSAEKTLGNFYLPITPKVASRIGMNYREPEGFDD